MTLTLFGVLVIALCSLLLWRGSTLVMLQAVLMLSLLGGSAALVLTGLGGSTVQPAILALGFLTLRCLLPGGRPVGQATQALATLVFLAVFVIYGALGAMILPRIFAGAIDVTPLRPIPNGYIFAAFPLSFSPQNVTSAVYLMATLMAALCAFLACSAPVAWRVIARTAGVVAVIHALLGLASVFLAGTAWSLFQRFFRNGFYAQLDQSLDGYARMTGIFPEAAVYSAYGFVWLVFTTELWLRGIESRWTGWGALLLGTALLLSTSTTAVIGLAAYAAILSLRLLLLPGSIAGTKVLALISGGLALLSALVAVVALNPEVAAALSEFVARFTVDKAGSASALQRAFWARQGVDALIVSSGLGIGPGSFRSSSIVLAVLGSTGIIGSLALLIHLARTFKPLHRSTYARLSEPGQATGAAASWAVLVALIPASFSAATPDPGFIWGALSGIALALRRPLPAPERKPETALAASVP